MSQPSNQPVPRYVVCDCQHCDGHIEFDANELTDENRLVPCPHCGLETKISIPIAAPLIQEPNASPIPPASSPRTVTYPLEPDGLPRYVTCYCEHCAGEIRFDANSLIVIGNKIPCPHCGLQTGIFAPQEEPKIIPAVAISNTKTSGVFSHKRVRFTKGTRVALTPTQCASPIGKELVDLLRDVVRDGLVPDEGVRRLNAWLAEKAESDIPAIKYLLQISDRVLRNGKVTTAKAFEMHFAIERVLPKSIREAVKEKRQEAWQRSVKASEAQLEYIRGLGGTPSPGLSSSEAHLLIEELLAKSPTPSMQPATEKQIHFIRELGENPPKGLSKSAASSLIEELLAKQHESQARQQSPSPRQIMIVRFWNRMDLEQSSKWEIEQWLSQFYDEDPRRKAAWELFKIESDDDGSQHDPSSVPVGAGESYLNKIP